MKKRGHRLLALGLAALLAFQTPVTVAAENEVQTETVAEERQETQQVQETEPPSEEQENLPEGQAQENTEYTENNSENEDREQTSYTWKYAPDIGWQLWSVDENNEESLCSPGVYALEDGIYYIKMYRVQEEDPDGEEVWQPVLAKGSAEITEETPVISEQNTEGKLAAGTYYYFYELDDTKENAHPEQGRYLTDTWVHPGEDPTVWYFANADGLLENPQNHAGPMHNEEGYFYLDAQGKSQAGTFEVDGIRYTYDGNGNRYQIRDGWQKENETWYYIENGSPMTGWKQIQGSWYYLDPADGSMKTGFFQDSSGTLYYTDAAGRMLSGNGWKQIRGNWYWVQPSGAIARGWKQNRGTWYYLDAESGAMHTGWYQVNGVWYYSDGSGAMMANGWLRHGGSWYYLTNSGSMHTGWLNQGGTWYYLNPQNGAMQIGWSKIGGNWYYFDGSGRMQSGGWLRLGNVWYYLTDSGAMYTGWICLNRTWYCLDPTSGAMQTGWYQIHGTWYYSNGSGAMQTGWLAQSGSWYYLNPNGAALTGWQVIGGTWYYFYPNCSMAANTWIDNYYVNSNGAWVDSTVVMPDTLYNYRFPTTATKKGLQVKDGMVDDAASLGVKHAVINIVLNSAAAGSGIEYVYEGKTYYMNTTYIHELDRQIKELHNNGMVITAVIVLQWDYQKQDLILPGARTYGYNLYGWNTVETEGRKHLEAICSFLARRYTAPDMGVVNWVCGNEVNAWKDYHYCGNISFDQYMEYYAQAYQVLYNSVKHAYTNGRIYMSIDHTWTYNRRANCYTSKAVLDCFAQLMKTKGIPDWMIAFHPYPSPELQSDFWNKTLNVIDSENSPIITMANLSYFTDYVKKNYGEGRRIILSECGFTSVSNGNEKQDVQAAAIAYGYYLAEANDMVDSFVVHRQVDHSVETAQGFYLGLWTCKPGALETAYTKKQAYDVFKYMDTRYYMTYTRFAFPLIKKTSWEQAVPGFNPAKFT